MASEEPASDTELEEEEAEEEEVAEDDPEIMDEDIDRASSLVPHV